MTTRHRIRILPAAIEAGAETGENLLEVIQRSGLYIEAECGGAGTCEGCRALIVEGRCEDCHGIIDKGTILTCQAQVAGDITLEVLASDELPTGEDYSIRHPADDHLHTTTDYNPLSTKTVLTVAPPSEGASDLERLDRGFPREGQLEFEPSALRELPAASRDAAGELTMTAVEDTHHIRVIKLEAGDKRSRNFGIACDVGTTTVALRLVDLVNGRTIDTVSSYNDQIDCGADIISRIIYSAKKGRLADLNDRIVNTVNRLLGSVLPKHGVSPEEVTAAAFAGNTTMTHLLLGIDPRHIRETPYVPAVKSCLRLRASALRIAIHPEAALLITPSVGSYVGGDITSGLLCLQKKTKSTGIRLFIDIGTNGELVIVGDDWLVGCACSAGPAFEGVGIACGMRAAEGAIESVDIGQGGKEISYHVIGGGRPRGICGSGLIELVAALLESRLIGRDGKFHVSSAGDGRDRRYVVVDAGETETGREIFISQHDIANIMRAKAAIFSACALLMKNIGISLEDIERVYVAGGFGSRLSFEKAITIGLFPDIGTERFEYLGNTSLQGAYLALLSAKHRAELPQIAKRMTYVDLSTEPDYMNQFTGALFLPHTDLNLFPSAKKTLGTTPQPRP